MVQYCLFSVSNNGKEAFQAETTKKKKPQLNSGNT